MSVWDKKPNGREQVPGGPGKFQRTISSLGEFISSIGIMIVSVAWTFGGVAGAIWAAVNDDLLDVVLSIFIPFYGAYYVIDQLLF